MSPDWLARSTASEDGADTAASTGMPAITAFWVSSKDARPLTSSTVPVERDAVGFQRPADDLVDGVVAADVFAHGQRGAVGPEQRGAVQPAGAGEYLLRAAQLLGHRREGFGGDRRRVVAGAVPADQPHRVQ